MISARPQRIRFTPHSRRAFNLIELLIALAISSVLLTATIVALNASFLAYQTTTEVSSTHTIARLTMHRVMAMIRTGTEFGPYPTDPLVELVESDYMEFLTPAGQVITLEYVEDGDSVGRQDNSLYVVVTDPSTGNELANNLLLEGVIRQEDESGNPLKPFVLQYIHGRKLYRATVDLTLQPDDNMSVTLDGNNNDQFIRLVASAMPRSTAY